MVSWIERQTHLPIFSEGFFPQEGTSLSLCKLAESRVNGSRFWENPEIYIVKSFLFSLLSLSMQRGQAVESSGAGSSRSPGFSLMEMMIVLAIMSILSAVVVGSLGTLRSTSLSVTTREFADFVNLCRSDAIARHTAIRVAIVESSSSDPDENYRKYTAFSWNSQSRQFEQYREWESLPGDLVFDQSLAGFVKKSTYYQEDPSSVRGDYLMQISDNSFDRMVTQLSTSYRFRFFEFSPSGRASAPGGDHRNLVVVIRPGEGGTAREIPNWSQFNIDTLTGRIRVYRP